MCNCKTPCPFYCRLLTALTINVYNVSATTTATTKREKIKTTTTIFRAKHVILYMQQKKATKCLSSRHIVIYIRVDGNFGLKQKYIN